MVILFSMVLAACSEIAANIWLSMWSSDVKHNATSTKIDEPSVRIGVYSSLGVLQSKYSYYLSIHIS